MIFVHSISRESLHFDQIRTKEAYLYFFNIHIPKFIFVRRNHIDCSQERPQCLGVALFRFRLLLVPVVLPSRSPDARAFSFLPWLTLGSHSIRPSRSVVTARRLYKFYIIFMRHKVVEKPTEEKRERVRARAGVRQRGSFSVQITPLGFLSSPPVDIVVTWLGGADRIPSFLLVGVRHEERGKPVT